MVSMLIRHQLTYDASPEEVYEMLSDKTFRDKVCDAMGAVSHDVVIDRTDEAMSVRIDTTQRTKGMPGFAKKVIGDQTRILQSEGWVPAQSADLEVELPGKPGHIRGTITLTGDESGTVESFAGEATMNIPLVGGKLEGLIEKLFIKGMDTEQRVGAAWLAGQR